MRIERDQVRTLLVLGLLLVGFGLAIWLPVRLQRQRLQRRVAVAQAQLAAERQAIADLPALAAEVIQLQRTMAAAERHIAPDADLGSFLRTLGGLAVAQRLADHEVQARPAVAASGYHQIPLNLTFRGSLPAIHEFLRRVEALPRLTRVIRVNLDGVPGRTDQVHGQVDLCTFYANAEAPAP